LSGGPLSQLVLSLLTDRVASVTQLDALLLVHSDPQRLWTAADVAADLRIGVPWAEDQLAHLARGTLVVRDHSGYRSSADPQTSGAVAELAAAYRTHPVAVVAAIYAKPDRRLQNFADAFRLRKDAPDTGAEGGPASG
jgi:hypothetical protein